MKVIISYGAAVATITFESDLLTVVNRFTVVGEISKPDLLHDVSVAGANEAMGFTRDAETCTSLVLLRTLEFMGYQVQWPEEWAVQAARFDDEEQDAADFGIVN